MHRYRNLIVSFVVAGALVSPSRLAFSQQFEPYSGERLFMTYCASCHGTDAKGDGVVAAVLAIPVPDLTVLSSENDGQFPGEWVYETIDGRGEVVAHGPRDMPVWGLEFWWEEGEDDTAEDGVRARIEALVAYLESIQQVPVERDLRSRSH